MTRSASECSNGTASVGPTTRRSQIQPAAAVDTSEILIQQCCTDVYWLSGVSMTSVRERDPGRRAEEAVRAVLPRAAKVRMGGIDASVDMMVNDHPFKIKWIGDGRRRCEAHREHSPRTARRSGGTTHVAGRARDIGRGGHRMG